MIRCSCCNRDATNRCLLATHNGAHHRKELLCDRCQQIHSEVASVTSVVPIGPADSTESTIES